MSDFIASTCPIPNDISSLCAFLLSQSSCQVLTQTIFIGELQIFFLFPVSQKEKSFEKKD